MIIKEIFAWVLLASVKMSVVVLLLLALTKPITKRYTAGFRYYSWLAVVIVFMIPFSKFGFTIDTSAATDSLQYHAREIIAELTPARKETAEVSAYVPTGETETVTAEDGAPIEVESREYVSGTVTYSEPVDIWLIASIIWAIGAAVYFLAHIGGYMSFRKAAKRVSYVSDNENVNAVFCEELRNLGLRRAPTLVVSAAVCSPMLVGLIRPMLILSERDYTQEELHLVFRHELIHYKRRDILYQLILLIFTAVHWFNPFAYILSSAASADGETACDERVLAGEDADTRKFYALMLITLLKSQKTSRQNAAVSGRGYMTTTFFGGKNGMKKRLTLIMNTKIKRAGKAAMAVLTAFALTLSLTAAAAESGYFSSVFEGDTSYLADFIQTPRQSVSDENYTLTVEQYLVTDIAVMIVYSIEAKTDEAIAELNALDDLGSAAYEGGNTVIGFDAVYFEPVEPEKVVYGGGRGGSRNYALNTRTKKYYMFVVTDIDNPDNVPFELRLDKISGAPSIIIPMEKNLETNMAVLGDMTIWYNPISMRISSVYGKQPFNSEMGDDCGKYLYFKMSDGSIKTMSQLFKTEMGTTTTDENNNKVTVRTYTANEVIKPGSIKSIIIYDVEYEVNDLQEPFGISEKEVSCLEYPLDDTDNPKEFDLPDEMKPFIMKPYIKNFMRIPLRELCEHIGANLEWNNDTRSATVSYRGSEFIFTENECYYIKDGEIINLYNEYSDNSSFIDEYGRLIVHGSVLHGMDINDYMVTLTDYSDLSKCLLIVVP